MGPAWGLGCALCTSLLVSKVGLKCIPRSLSEKVQGQERAWRGYQLASGSASVASSLNMGKKMGHGQGFL